MSWVTPKTNWVSTDYYNLEDAQRIAGNICHLADMAIDHYNVPPSGNPVYCLTYRTTIDNVDFFGIEIVLSTTYLNPKDPSLYTLGSYYWADLDSYNLAALSMLIMLTSESEPVYRENVRISRYLTNPNNTTFTGYCISNTVDNNDYSNKPFEALWGRVVNVNESDLAKLPLHVAWGGYYIDGGYKGCRTEVNGFYGGKVNNKTFYTADLLNKIESATLAVYNRLTSYMGG